MHVLTSTQIAVIRGILDVACGRATAVPLATYLTNVLPKEEPCGKQIAAFLLKAYSDVQRRESHIIALGGPDEFERYLLEGVFAILAENQLSKEVTLSSLEGEAAPTDFADVGRQIGAAASHELARRTGTTDIYENHCWSCQSPISSAINPQCPRCRRYICNSCGACLCRFLNS